MTQSNSERRNYPRFLAPQLCVSLLSINQTVNQAINKKITNTENTISNNDTQIELKTVDFNHLGMSVNSLQHFNIGDVLHLVITDENNHSEDVYCFVCNRAKTDLGYRCGLHFLNSGSRKNEANYSPSTTLLAIEQTLNT